MERPNPDQVLKRVNADEARRGKLKIFFGAMAGVGKTYTMLESARNRKKENIDVVIGYVETHKRAETEALVNGMEILPRKNIQYKNVSLPEFDVDGALKRNPKLILVDELAHSNAPGSRHAKRWQDIEELLDKGINVYTTLNVQHCESVNDIIYRITEIVVRETVPDTFIEMADEIELVDLPTEELLKRLKEGKVYISEQATRAAENFFKPGNLIALRQLALRYTAQRVDYKLQNFKQINEISKVWNVVDRFLVCISPSPGAIRLIRAGKRIASDLKVNWIVAFVETPLEINKEDKNRISEMLRFAEKLGAETVTLSGLDIAETLITYARSKNITKIVVGKPGKPRLKEKIFGSVIDKFARQSGEIDLYLLSGESQDETGKIKPVTLRAIPRMGIVWSVVIVAFCTVINKFLFLYLDVVNLIMIYFLGIIWISYRFGRRVSMIASFFSVILFDFFFVEPYYSFQIADAQYLITFGVMLVVGFTLAHLTGQLQHQTITASIREERTQALYSLSRDLSKSSYPDELFSIALKHTEDFFKCRAFIFTPDNNNKLVISFGKNNDKEISINEYAVAEWVFEHKKPAGKNTDTLSSSIALFLPFIGLEKTVGVIGLIPKDDVQFNDPEQFHMLEMFTTQTAQAVEGAILAVSAIDVKSKIENERMKNLLLTTFSYELHEPLKTISKTVSELLNLESINDELKRLELIKKIKNEADLVNTLIDDLPEIIDSQKSI